MMQEDLAFKPDLEIDDLMNDFMENESLNEVRNMAFANIGMRISHPSDFSNADSTESSQHQRSYYDASPPLSINTSSAPSPGMNMDLSALIKILSRSEIQISSLANERDSALREFANLQQAYQQAVADKKVAEEKLDHCKTIIRNMGTEALQQALHQLKEAFDRAPIPRGIRFAPTDYEVFDYLSKKISGTSEDIGLGRFLVRRLRGINDCDGLIPEVELLKFPRPWHLPGLDVAPDGKGQVGYYFVKPEWRPNERRRRREADMAPNDPKPPCWKESCQPTVFDDLLQFTGGRPERRMFRFKLPGAREGPSGEKEKWKMYEYTLKTDADMYEEKRAGLPVWVICKVIREGSSTSEEQEERLRHQGMPGGSSGGSGLGGEGSFSGGSNNFGSFNPGGQSGSGGDSLGGGGYGSLGSQYFGRQLAGLGTESKDGNAPVSRQLNEENPEKNTKKSMGEDLGSSFMSESSFGNNFKDAGVDFTSQQFFRDWLNNTVAEGNETQGSGTEGTPGPNSRLHWMASMSDVSAFVGRLLEDYFVSKLIVQIDGSEALSDGDRLSPPSWRIPIPDSYWSELDSEEESELGPEEIDEEVEEFIEEDEESAPSLQEGSELQRVMTSVKELAKRMDNIQVSTPVSVRLSWFLHRMDTLLKSFVTQVERDEPNANQWLKQLDEELTRVAALTKSLETETRSSRILLLVKTPEMAEKAKSAVKDLGRVLSLLPKICLQGMTPEARMQLNELVGNSQNESFEVRDTKVVSAVDKLQEVLRVERKGEKKGKPDDKSQGPPKEPLDEAASFKALVRLREELLGWGKKGNEFGVHQPMQVQNLFIEVFKLVGVDCEVNFTDEFERLKGLKSGDDKFDSSAEGGARSASDDALREGLLSLIKNLVSASDSGEDLEEDAASTGDVKKGKEVEGIKEDDLKFKCPVISKEELERILSEGKEIRVGDYTELDNVVLTIGEPVYLEFLNPKSAPRLYFYKQVELLHSQPHEHLFPVAGCVPDLFCIAYKRPSGLISLEAHLQSSDVPPHPDSPFTALPWFVRVRIAFEITSTLSFLHSNGLLHKRLTPSSVLLVPHELSTPDGTKRTLTVRLSKVGMSRSQREALAPDFMYEDPAGGRSSTLRPASDIYSLGIILAQLLTGKSPPKARRRIEAALESNTPFTSCLDDSAGDWPMEESRILARWALRCTEYSQSDRPELKAILPDLLQLQESAVAAELRS